MVPNQKTYWSVSKKVLDKVTFYDTIGEARINICHMYTFFCGGQNEMQGCINLSPLGKFFKFYEIFKLNNFSISIGFLIIIYQN